MAQDSLRFIHLKVHSAYSLAEGAIRIKDLLDFCKTQQMPAVALTDSCNTFGAMDFSLSAAKAGIQPIIGTKLKVRTPFPKEIKTHIETHQEWSYHDLTLLAKSQIGYQNLIKIISRARLSAPVHLHLDNQEVESHHYISFEELSALKQDLIVLTGGTQGPIAGYLLKEDPETALRYLLHLKDLFPHNLYIELHRFGLPEEHRTENALIELAYQHHVPLVATNEAFFVRKEQYLAHDALRCIATGKLLSDPKRQRLTPDHRLKTVSEMAELFQDLPEALENTVNIAKQCHFLLEPLTPLLPSFPSENGRSESDELRAQAEEGLRTRLVKQVFTADMTAEHQAETEKLYFDRLDFEIKVINQMGYPGYYLIVAEFIKYAKAQKIPVGPGRGSGAGSLVAWALTITDVDPIKFNLIFERFLNPERVSMPDFDIDFCQERRDEVIKHVCRKYGHDKVAQIITFGKLQAKAVVRDVGRVLGMPYGQVDKLSKLIPANPANPVSLQQALEQEPEIALLYRGDAEIKELIDIALQLEGLYRHASTHAAGIVIGQESLENIVALYQDDNSDMPATQFNMKFVELASLVKFDFLGLKTLSVMQYAVDRIREVHGIEVNLAEIPLDDKKTFDLLKRIETVGIFQLESAGMREVIRKLQPEQFEEVIALVALYRPGPMDDIPRYIACRNGTEEVRYAHPLLEEILQETYGVMVYQEQVMQIAQKLAGYSLGQADLLRRAMGKKIASEMEAQREIFIKGCKTHNDIPETTASEIFAAMAKFASYGFNKCHSAPYGLIAYQTAYLKANYPVEFIAAMMTYDMGNTDKLGLSREELNRLNIPLLPPDINASFARFTVEKVGDQYGVRYALAALKNAGEPAINAIVAEREQNGPFVDIIDFVRRLDSRAVNKRLLESLIAAGAFDRLDTNRAKLMGSLDIVMRYVGENAKRSASSQVSLFDGGDAEALPPVKLADSMPWSRFERAHQEFEAIGFYLSEHPVEAYQELLSQYQVKTYQQVQAMALSSEEKAVTLAGVIASKKERLSKSGNKYAFVQFSDPSGLFEGVLFSEAYTNGRALLETGIPLLIRATVKREDEEIKMMIQGLQKLDESASAGSKTLSLTIKDPEALLQVSASLMLGGSGQTQVELQLHCDQFISVVALKDRYKVTPKTLDALSIIRHVQDIKVA
jgi:DNA polymerase III, alpha subunit (EC 2.7.7.7)